MNFEQLNFQKQMWNLMYSRVYSYIREIWKFRVKTKFVNSEKKSLRNKKIDWWTKLLSKRKIGGLILNSLIIQIIMEFGIL